MGIDEKSGTDFLNVVVLFTSVSSRDFLSYRLILEVTAARGAEAAGRIKEKKLLLSL